VWWVVAGCPIRHQTQVTERPGKGSGILDCPERVLLERKVGMPLVLMRMWLAVSLKVAVDTSHFANVVKELLQLPELFTAGLLLLMDPGRVRLHGYRGAHFSSLALDNG
jgi:hypothetical protein